MRRRDFLRTVLTSTASACLASAAGARARSRPAFAAHVDGFTTTPNILRADTVAQMDVAIDNLVWDMLRQVNDWGGGGR